MDPTKPPADHAPPPGHELQRAPFGGLRRILKVLAALAAANAIALITQLLLPPVFLYRYGTAYYGEWLALSAAVSYLGNLNFGIQTFVNQDLTVRYQRNELEDLHVRQSTALRILLGIVIAAAFFSTIVFALPVRALLKITISQHTAALALYFLSLQMLAGIIFGYFSGTFMVVGKAHRGYSWVNAQRLLSALVAASLAWFRVDFSLLALAQFLVYVLAILLVLFDLRRIAPDIFPSLRYWDGSAVKGILKPSGHFALIFSCGFLVFQLPVLILQRILGPVSVVAFTVMRTIFSMARQLLAALTQSMGPEITRLYGLRDWRNLSLLYTYSERTVFSLIPCINLGTLLLSPVLLTLWLHRPALFSLWPYIVCAAVSTVMSAKEHKHVFQFSTNTHEPLARMMFLSYLIMVAIAIPAVSHFGLAGFLVDWLVFELLQLLYIFRLNTRLFASTGSHEMRYMARLAVLCGGGFIAAEFLLRRTLHMPIPVQCLVALGFSLVLLSAAFPLFHLGEVARRLTSRFAST